MPCIHSVCVCVCVCVFNFNSSWKHGINFFKDRIAHVRTYYMDLELESHYYVMFILSFICQSHSVCIHSSLSLNEKVWSGSSHAWSKIFAFAQPQPQLNLNLNLNLKCIISILIFSWDVYSYTDACRADIVCVCVCVCGCGCVLISTCDMHPHKLQYENS